LSNYIANKNTLGVIGIISSLIFSLIGVFTTIIIFFFIGIAIFIGIIIICVILKNKKGLLKWKEKKN